MNPLNLSYNPEVFLRCHSKTDADCADVRTKVWQVVFDPYQQNEVATCGGNKLCLINLKTFKVEQRYSAGDKEILYAIAWSYLVIHREKRSVLISGGDSGVLYFIDVKNHCQFAQFLVPRSSKQSKIFSITFHPDQKNSIFCAMDTGEINFIKATFDSKLQLKIDVIASFSCHHEITRTAICDYSHTLFAATSSGLYGWSLSVEDLKEWNDKIITFNLQTDVNNEKPPDEIVDSLEILNDGFIASKFGLHPFIYVWHVEHSIVNSDSGSRILHIKPFYKLIWSFTDNYYIELSYNHDIGVLICGYDEGSIWMYDMRCLRNHNFRLSDTEVIEVSQVIDWPVVEDEYLARSKKLSMDTDDIIISKAIVSSNGKFLVAITDRNAVCLWSRNC